MQFIVESSAVLNTGVWYHLVATYDGSTNANGVNLYINNVANNNIVTDSLSGVISNSEPLQIGGQDTFFTAGQIAKTRIWNVELTASEVATMYNGGTIQKQPNTTSKLDCKY